MYTYNMHRGNQLVYFFFFVEGCCIEIEDTNSLRSFSLNSECVEIQDLNCSDTHFDYLSCSPIDFDILAL